MDVRDQILTNVVIMNYINRHLAFKNTLIAYRFQNISFLRNSALLIISFQTELADIQTLPDKNDSVRTLCDQRCIEDCIMCSTVQN